MGKKYYVEFVCESEIQEKLPENCIAQSGWKDSIEECLKWATKLFHFFFMYFDYQVFTEIVEMRLMSSVFDEDNDKDFEDVEQECLLIYDHHYAKVVRQQDVYKERLPF